MLHADPITQHDLEELQSHLDQRVDDVERELGKLEDKVVDLTEYATCRFDHGVLFKGSECPLCRLERRNPELRK